MKVLIISQYFWPEGFRINDLALGLRDRGHEVTVLAGKPNYPAGAFFPGYGFFRRSRDDFQGIPVIRVPLIPRGAGSSLRLALNYISFAFFASVLAPFRCRGAFDAILVYEPSPITVALPGIVLRWLKRAPLLLWVQDLWPESLSATNAVRKRWILRLVESMVRFIYRRCDRILGQIHADARRRDHRRPAGVEAGLLQSLPPRVARLEIDGHEPQERRNAVAEVDEALALPRLRTGLIDLEHDQP